MTSVQKIRLALASDASWPRLRARIRALTAAELGEADRLERLGRRRTNLLMCLKAERHRRQGRAEKMLRLRVEVQR